MKAPNKRGGLDLHEIPTAIVILVVIVLFLVIGANILSSTGKTQCNSASGFVWNATTDSCYLTAGGPGGTIASNTSANGLTGMQTFSGWIPTIAIVLAASAVIGLVMAYLAFGKRE